MDVAIAVFVFVVVVVGMAADATLLIEMLARQQLLYRLSLSERLGVSKRTRFSHASDRANQ